MSSTGADYAGAALEQQPLIRRSLKARVPSLNLQYWHSSPFRQGGWNARTARAATARFLSSKAGHYSVLALVSLDVLSMIAGLLFSCLFVAELIACIWAFGWDYFNSWFHCFDAFIVVAGFITDVALRGVIEEVASLIVVMRLWRVVKIIEELGLGAQEQTEELSERLEECKKENEVLRKQLDELRGVQ
ncbi:voltage-gated hydrogen channel 1 [Fusarium sporotrichioides]|uniref:Voltage-gated hydrogen channel 1 n=1 Tax=Fusarium sporotrichioides TaxID=5514 RepID=A0A395RHG1_FUSSP|nr:voltage-gated hydrogen channel 1 [Fusarium sporotrichioides]